ncbi:MAG: hypothetical protein Q8N91_06975 [Candidatus Omnitrophota bacterium]|nr:hypothetical protein [Candidatus Omnitrophota bacterium]
MNRKRLSIVLTALFLVQIVPFTKIFCEEAVLLNPSTLLRVDTELGRSINPSAKVPSIYFKQIYGIMCMALSIYKADAVRHSSKEDLIRRYDGAFPDRSARFDLNNIDIGKKGWTRYYPFAAGNKNFIARIFLTEERFYQPNAPVLFQAHIDNPAVTIQILPGVNEILRGCQIKPHPAIYPATEIAASP